MRLERREEVITVDEGFDAMRAFLHSWWERGGRESEDALWLINAMGREHTSDGGPADSAMWTDFLEALDQVKASRQ